MSDEAALLTAIRDNPDEDTPRLVYADWLDENATTNAQRGRAEFIRIQCAYSNLPPSGPEREKAEKELSARSDELFAEHGKAWYADFPPVPIEEIYYTGGFLQRLVVPAKKCAKTPRPPWFREPFMTVELSGTPAQIQPLIETGWLDGVAGLDLQLSRPGGGDALLRALAASECPRGLDQLSLWTESLTDRGLRAIAGASFERLRRLSLLGRFSADGWAAVLNSSAGARLEDLTLGRRGPWQTAERDCPGPALAAVLEQAPSLGGLKQLWLLECGLGDAGLAQVIRSGRFPKIEWFHIDNDRAGTATGAALASAQMPALRDLAVSQCELEDEAFAALVNGPLLSRLHVLRLSLNRLTARSAQALAGCGRTAELKNLDFGCNPIRDDGAIALANSRNFPALTDLSLASTEITDVGADAVLKAEWTSQLTTLFLSYNAISVAKEAELTARFGSVLWLKRRVDDDDDD